MMIKTAKVVKMLNERGQILLILILVMTVALAIGISVIQRSLSDISTSTKVEESSRAFSAAEAGIEKALTCATPGCGGHTIVSFAENQSSADVPDSSWGPGLQSGANPQAALEYPPLSKERVVQVWLADPDANLPTCAAPNVCYAPTTGTLDVYWGDPNAAAGDKAALELTLVYYDGSKYVNRKWYLEDDSAIRSTGNNFTGITCSSTNPPVGYKCKYKIGGTNFNGQDLRGPLPAFSPNILMLLRARLLYNDSEQPFAVQATGTCGQPCSLPPQIRTLISTGTAGGTQRTIKVFQTRKFVPFLDFAIFSVGEINK